MLTILMCSALHILGGENLSAFVYYVVQTFPIFYCSADSSETRFFFFLDFPEIIL